MAPSDGECRDVLLLDHLPAGKRKFGVSVADKGAIPSYPINQLGSQQTIAVAKAQGAIGDALGRRLWLLTVSYGYNYPRLGSRGKAVGSSASCP
jgi:hypothetical protein